MSKPVHICLISPLSVSIGGIARWAQLLLAWIEADKQCEMTHIDIGPRWRPAEDLRTSRRVLWGGLQFITDTFALVRVLIRHDCDAIHLTSSSDLGVLRDTGIFSLAKLFRVPVIYHLHSGRIPVIAKSGGARWHLIKRMLLMTQHAIAIDKATLTLVQASLPAVSVSLLPNCINSSTPTLSHQNPALQPTVLFIGWVLAEKGLKELINAWELLQPRGWLLKLIGPGGENYQRAHLHRPRSGNLEFCGALPHPQTMSELDACEILVLPSHTEGFPNVILEAMSRGKPVVATSVGAIPEMLCDDCGVLVKPQDVTSLAAGLEMLIHQPELRLAMGEKARQRVETHYSCATVFPKLLRIWEEAGSENV